ncbi:MAG: SUMF1/EgtB/PvdO family nonheme iron enzyme [Anaerolineales bacterium]|nr:SUMF1/EgtB/PvdO family nonheme iron enzyme [Anaerolineales bacterium]
MSDFVGQSLGRYHILELLGEGGMAFVYKAYDTRLEREVAVKVIRSERLTIETMARTLKRFEREAKALARLTHLNIVPLSDYGEFEGQPYLVMPYLAGGTLKDRLGQPIPWREALHLLLPVARALAYAHGQGVIHRDVKPSNILLTASGDPLLTDFGIAKVLADAEATVDLTGTGVGVGTLEYMAPEQFQGQVGPETDIYALGVVLYEMVTGRKPYAADTPAAIIIQQATVPLPRPRQFAPDLPEAVERVLLRALAKRPEERYPDMGRMVDALEGLAAAGDPPGRARRRQAKAAAEQGPVLPAPKKRRGWPWAAGLLVLGLGLVWGADRIGLGSGGQGPLAGLATDTLPLTPTPILGIGSSRVRPADGMVMVYVPAGAFPMGSREGASDEEPVHTVTLEAYWIDRTEVTNGMYAACVAEGACPPPSSARSNTRSPYYGNPAYADYPVIYVDWNDAQAYCEWTGGRLPSEAEWEKAARGTDGRRYPWGDLSPTAERANYHGSSVGDTQAVGSFPAGASPYGALDMAGNVWEWTADWYDAHYYSRSPEANPTGPASGTYRLLRGGSWDYIGSFLRSALRLRATSGNSSYGIGFRCVHLP